MSRIRNNTWKDDDALKLHLEELVRRRYLRKEILQDVRKKFPQYAWGCERTLGNRLRSFNIKYIDYGVDIANVFDCVGEEIQGPGGEVGYRALTKKIREIHKLNVPRDLVYNVMATLDPAGLQRRGGVGLKKRKARNRQFVSQGPNCTISMDGHDKLCGFQKNTFPLCIYGAQDSWSGKMLFLRIWTSNNKPGIVARYYYEYLEESRVLPARIRVDRGTETDDMLMTHGLFHMVLNNETMANVRDHRVMHGTSTQNKIERWWRELHHRMEVFFKQQLSSLIDQGIYDSSCELDRNILAYVYIPIIQKELDIFKNVVWNHSRGRTQKGKALPTGIPEVMFEHPEGCNPPGEDYGCFIPPEAFTEISQMPRIAEFLNNSFDFMDPEVRLLCERLIPNPSLHKSHEADMVYSNLRAEVMKAMQR